MALVPYTNEQQLEETIEIITDEPFNENGYSSTGGVKCAGRDKYLNIVIASTLNGILTALDGETGELLWVHRDSPLLDGTLSLAGPIEVGGTSLQLMPTLDGRLFSYAHQSNLIEPLPITTESLLESTVRLGRDAVAGGKSVTTTGINVVTGEIRYKCSPDSCANEQQGYSEYPTLLVKRISNSIRAMDSLEGTERWNLSTAELNLSLAGIGMTHLNLPKAKFLLRPPEGIITATTRYGDEEWTANVGGHLVNVWHVYGNTIREISLFDPRNMFTTQMEVGHRLHHNLPEQTSLFYMGTSNGYPFIIQSPKSKQNLKNKMKDVNEFDMLKEIAGPKLCSANSEQQGITYEVEDTALLVVLRNAFGKSHSKMIEDKSSRNQRKTLTIVAHNDENLNENRCFGSQKPGVALIGLGNFRTTSLLKDGDQGFLVLDSQSCKPIVGNPPLPVKIMSNISSYFKHFWAFLISGIVGAVYTFARRRKLRALVKQRTESSCDESLESSSVHSSAIIENVIAKYEEAKSEPNAYLRREPLRQITFPSQASPNFKAKDDNIKAETSVETEYSQDEENKKKLLRNRTISRTSLEGFTSRFAAEFEVKKVIGHGGFGVVFRATCLTDTTDYAVKRIAVADNEKARNKVLREARALARFDHPGIIRYFFSWEERPPKGFQEQEDEKLLGKIKAEKLKKIHGIKKKKRNNVQSNAQSPTNSFAETFEMPAVVGNTENNSWNVSDKKNSTQAQHTTSENRRGLAGTTDKSESIVWDSNSGANRVHESSSSSDSSDDDEEDGNERQQSSSSSGLIEFVEEGDGKNSPNKISSDISLHNKAIIVATENNELELRETSSPGDCAYLYIVMQLCDERTLEDWIRKNSTEESRTLSVMKNWIKQLAEALEYLHDKGFIHRDLKPGNIFFSSDSKPEKKILKIGDLGLATNNKGKSLINSGQIASNSKHTRNVGTRSYMSPEQLNNASYSEKIDIFALGLVATELIIPFATAMERIDTFTAYQNGTEPPILKDYPKEKDFMLQLTNIDASKRPSAKDVAENKFLA
ncbi:unnamed protein product [Caenorhabditis bovis]|uniref:PRKR-like endoplasmic reticulum kinase n=1 Tax=Caenorhabditis bovis TaxID=2654633 RepID=A0A8S1EIV0_9PELO|nr:unnamed protein product [Caenorhabditis bovis]